MIILFNRSGQICNQWLAFVSCLAIAHQKKQKLVYPMMDPLFEKVFFLREEALDNVEVKIYNNRLLYLLSRMIIKLISILNIKISLQKKERKIYFLWNWNSSVDYEAMRREQRFIVDVVAFSEAAVKKIDEWWKYNICTEETTVAVHMRRGDYRDFSGGIYYYSNEEYLRWMKELMQEKKNIRFLLFSNESIEKKDFSDISSIVMRGNTAEDLYAMSKCDYIMGPPSSFSRCAAYMGKKKRLVLMNRYEKYSFSQFYDSTDIKFYESHVKVGV